MRLIILCLAILLVQVLNAFSADESVLVPFDKQPSWSANPGAAKVVKGTPSFLELSTQNEICQEVKIPGFDSILVDLRMPAGKTGRLFLKLLEDSGAEYITPTLDLKGTGDWQSVEFKFADLFVAYWSDDDNYHVDLPFNRVYLVFTSGDGASFHVKNLRVRGADARRPTAEYTLVSDWIQRLASSEKPGIPSPPNPDVSRKVIFADEASSISLKAPGYELALDRESGKLIRLKFGADQDAWKPSDGRWWSLVSFDGDLISNTKATSFKHAWDGAKKQLRLAYLFGNKLEVVLVTSGTEDSLRCKAFVKNVGMSPIRCLRIPDGFPFDVSRLKRMVLPRLGGVELLPGYFKSGRRLAMDYPSDAMSDFAFAEVLSGGVSIYSVQDEPTFWSSRLKLRNLPDQGRAEYTRDTNTFVGEGGVWVSPSVVFLSAADPLGAFGRYWSDNELDKSPSLAKKLGESLFERLSTSVLLKYDFDYIAPKTGNRSGVFSDATGMLRSLPSPILLHPVDYWNPPETGRRADGGVFDTNYPEFLPPRDEFGGSTGFNGFLAASKWIGLPVMPYTNPTCWSKESASYRKSGDDVGLKNADGSLSMGWGMVTVTPSHPEVQAKNRANLTGFTTDPKVDILFEDQVGARSHYYDFSPKASHPAAYTQGLISHAKEASAKIPLMTERGFDRLVSYESGFCGIELGLSCTTFMRGWEWDNYYGKGNWRVFPLDTYFIGPHAALYHHDLGQFVLTKGDISWCLAKGYNMTFAYGHPDEKLRLCDAFQKTVSSRSFGQRLSSFEYVSDNVTKTVFPQVTIYANHSADTTFDHDRFTLAREGCLALDENGEMIAGILTRMNGLDLGREANVLQTNDPGRVQVRCIACPDGPIAIRRPKEWTDADKITVLAVGEADQPAVECQVAPDSIQFQYSSSLDGKPVTGYTLLYGR